MRKLKETGANPVVHRWRWNLSDMDLTAEELVVGTLLTAKKSG